MNNVKGRWMILSKLILSQKGQLVGKVLATFSVAVIKCPDKNK